MKKLISLLVALMMSLGVYSIEPEYTSVGKQFNTVVLNVPATLTIKKSAEHSVKVTNESSDYYNYEISNDTLFIKSKYSNVDVTSMKADKLRVSLTHPSPEGLLIQPTKRELDLKKTKVTKSGNQN